MFFGNNDLFSLMNFKDQRSKFHLVYSNCILFAREILVHRTDVVLLDMINTDIFQNCTEYYEGLLNFMQGGC